MRQGNTYYESVFRRRQAVGQKQALQYAYCANNPVNLIDPNGKEIFGGADWITYTGSDAQAAFSQLKNMYESDDDDNDRDNDTGVKNPIWDLMEKFRAVFSFMEDVGGTSEDQKLYTDDENGYYNTAVILSDKIGVPQRAPDFYTFNLSFAIPGLDKYPLIKKYTSGGFSFTLDRDFQFYISLLDASIGRTSITKKISYSLTANWTWQYKTPTSEQLYNFLQGSSTSFGAGWGLGVNYIHSFNDDNTMTKSAWGFGLFSPQVNYGSYSYTPSFSSWGKK